MSAHYDFEAVFYNPASGKKGLVEGLVGYIRRNVYVLILRTEATDDLNRMMLEKYESNLSYQVLEVMLAQKQDQLHPLPDYPFDPCRPTSGGVAAPSDLIQTAILFLLLYFGKLETVWTYYERKYLPAPALPGQAPGCL